MWKRLSLRTRILVLLIALVITTIGGGLVTLWHNEAMDSLLTSLIDKNVASYHAAEELENALLQQKGYLTYYFLDGNPEWLKEIDRYNGSFEDWLGKARKSAYTEAMRETIAQIDTQYHQYVLARERVINLYREGKKEAGAQQHWEIRHQYIEILNLCRRYKVTHEFAICPGADREPGQGAIHQRLRPGCRARGGNSGGVAGVYPHQTDPGADSPAGPR